MFQLVLGPSGHGKTAYIRKLLCDTVRETGREAILLVPEQYTFATERAVLEEAGPRRSARIHVWSFTRLSEEVFLRYGGIREKRLSDTGKTVLMSLAVRNCREQLAVYGESSERVTRLMLEAVDEFKACLITPEDLAAAGSAARGGLKNKLRDIGLIYGAYEALLANTYIDTEDLLTRAAEILREHPEFFQGTVVALDGFESFNRQKLAVLSLILRHAEDSYAALCADSAHTGTGSVLEPVNKTAAKLTALAAEERVEMRPPVFLREGGRFAAPELAYLERSLFVPAALPWEGPAEAVRIFEGRTVYQEAEFAASSIRRMVMTGGYRYGEFALLCRDASKYYPVIGSTFEKWNVPCYFSEPKRLDGEPLLRLLLSAYRVVQRGFRTEDLLTMLKSGLCPISSEELSELENYVFLWKISGKDWKAEFTRHPEGFGRPETPASRAALEALNETRRRVIAPLIHFADRTRDATGRDISGAIYGLLTDLKVDQRILENAARYEAAGRPELVGEGAALWQKLMDILDEFVLVFGEQSVSREEYFGYLESVLAKEEVRDIPLRLDTVTFGTADLLKLDHIRAVFVLGAVQGELPRIPVSGGIFTDHERLGLMELSLPLEDHLEEQTKLERFIAYRAVTAPAEKLFLSYHVSHAGEDLAPSELVDAVRGLFPSVEVERELPPDLALTTYSAAFSALAAGYRERDRLSSTLLRLFEEKEEYRGKLSALQRAASEEPCRIRSPRVAREMFGSQYISASQIDVYHRCPFQYFCRYGLGAKERKPAELNVLEYGTLMHYLFEAVLSGGFSQYLGQEALLRADLETLIRRYADEKMGGFDSMSGRDQYRFRRMCDTAVTLLVRLMEELSSSEFEPAYFELALEEGGPFPPLRIRTEAGTEVKVGGIIDRVDLYKAPEGTYVRVVDYKTGKKEFKLLDALYGLNLQMLIYLAAMVQNGAVLPAGVLYMPSAAPGVSAERGMTGEELRKELDKKLAMSGVVLDDAGIINAMERGASGRFLPTGIKENGKYTRPDGVLSASGFETLFRYVRSLVATMANSLIRGEVEARPLLVNGNPCSWCPYGSVCLSQRDDREVRKVKLPRKEILEAMDQRKKESVPAAGRMGEDYGKLD